MNILVKLIKRNSNSELTEALSRQQQKAIFAKRGKPQAGKSGLRSRFDKAATLLKYHGISIIRESKFLRQGGGHPIENSRNRAATNRAIAQVKAYTQHPDKSIAELAKKTLAHIQKNKGGIYKQI